MSKIENNISGYPFVCKSNRNTMQTEQTHIEPSTDEIKKEEEIKPRYIFKSYEYSQKVVDGKVVQKKKGLKRVDDKWFVLKDNDSWELSTKEQVLTAPSVVKLLQAIEDTITETVKERSPQGRDTCSSCRNHNPLLTLLLLSALTQQRRPLSLLDLLFM